MSFQQTQKGQKVQMRLLGLKPKDMATVGEEGSIKLISKDVNCIPIDITTLFKNFDFLSLYHGVVYDIERDMVYYGFYSIVLLIKSELIFYQDELD